METSALNDKSSRARVLAASPLMFESEDEYILDNEPSVNSSSKENGLNSEDSIVEPTREEKHLKGFQTILMGIPPPPAFTVPQLDSREILKMWRDNQKFKVVLSPGKIPGQQEGARKLEHEARTLGWPEVLGLDHWDLYYNKSAVSEEVARLSMRYKERYVGAETSSCINALFVKSPVRTASARKRARTRAWGHSPGRRLSHLARRRKAFSSANLCSVAGNNNPDKKMIMVEIKKMGNRQKKKNSAKKSKPTPNKKSLIKANSHKRALFQSPDQLPQHKAARTPSSQCIQRSKRNLFAESSSEKKVNENGKRERPVVKKISPRKRVNRTLSFHDNTQATAPQQAAVPPSATLTALTGAHKQKMLWAATNALREESMGMNHELFRPCMTVLFKTCQRLWLNRAGRQGPEGSTSENMLALARQFTTYTIKEISSDPTSEHMALVCANIIKMAEKTWSLSKPASASSSGVSSKPSSVKGSTLHEVSIVNIPSSSTGRLEKSDQEEKSDTDKQKFESNNSIPSPTHKLHERTPSKINLSSKNTPKKICSSRKSPRQCMVKSVVSRGVLAESPTQSGVKRSSPRLSRKLVMASPEPTSQVPRSRRSSVNVATSVESGSEPVTGTEQDVVEQVEQTLNVSEKPSTKINKKQVLKLCLKKVDHSLRRNGESKLSDNDSPALVDSERSLSQNSNGNEETKSERDFETNKENIDNQRVVSDCSQKSEDGERNSSQKRLVDSTPLVQIVPKESTNRTLQLYRLSNSGGEHIETDALGSAVFGGPPKLVPHWEQVYESENTSSSSESPPSLVPHWEQFSCSGTSTSLPESIMSHWQQVSGNVNPSDKIMFDFEDTSYEITFPTNNDDTQASSVCAPFDFPHLVDDSKSCSNTVFRRINSDFSDQE